MARRKQVYYDLDETLAADIPELRALLPQPPPPSMPYGKHEGTPLTSISRGYLADVLENHVNFENSGMTDEEFNQLKRQIKDAWSEQGLPFGKYINEPLREVPSDYLEWLLSRPNSRDYPTTRSIIKRELRHRRERHQ